MATPAAIAGCYRIATQPAFPRNSVAAHPVGRSTGRVGRSSKEASMLTQFVRSCAATGVVLVLLALPQWAAADAASQCPEPDASMPTIAALFDRWNASLATGKPEEVAMLYADDAVLLPTLSDRPHVGRDEIGAYFAQLLQRHPQGSVTQRTIRIDCATAVDAGAYVLRVTGRRKGTRMLIGGRYLLQYEYRNGDWLIVRHQVSDMYRPLSSAGDLADTGKATLSGVAQREEDQGAGLAAKYRPSR
jgi:uncharacterized protein (TIGR02246 family)